MKKHFTLLIIALALSTTLFSQTITGSFTWDGLERSYRVYIPPSYEPGDSWPLVLNYHGFTSNAAQQELYSGMNNVADTANFLIAYPEGISNSWNVGWAFGSTADDVGFTNALIDTLHANYDINLDRVYSTGMSNGGFFSYRLACELNDRIAKIASVTGGMINSQVAQCMPDNPIPIMQIHGTADDVVNYNGTAGVNIPTEDLIENWLDINGCVLASDTIFIEDTNTNDGSTAQLIQYRDCDDNTMFAFFKIIGGGHTWPGAGLVIGVTNQDFNASSEVWNFFNDQYPVNAEHFDVEVDVEVLEFHDQKITAFPNPFSEGFRIESSEAIIESVEFYNSIGQLVDFIDHVDNKQLKIENVSWEKGLYFARVRTEKGVFGVWILRG